MALITDEGIEAVAKRIAEIPPATYISMESKPFPTENQPKETAPIPQPPILNIDWNSKIPFDPQFVKELEAAVQAARAAHQISPLITSIKMRDDGGGCVVFTAGIKITNSQNLGIFGPKMDTKHIVEVISRLTRGIDERIIKLGIQAAVERAIGKPLAPTALDTEPHIVTDANVPANVVLINPRTYHNLRVDNKHDSHAAMIKAIISRQEVGIINKVPPKFPPQFVDESSTDATDRIRRANIWRL